MKGKYRVVLQNNRLHYEFEIRRNITIIQGDSATGKTTLINMLRQAENLGRSSGVDVVCEDVYKRQKICSLREAQEAHTYKARMKCIVQHNKKNPDRSDTKKKCSL